MDLCDSEKQFILSLSEIMPESEGVPPLLGDEPPPERYGPLAGPYASDTEGNDAGTCVVPLGPKKTLVLDLDETLVASTRTPVSCDFKVKVCPGVWAHSSPVRRYSHLSQFWNILGLFDACASVAVVCVEGQSSLGNLGRLMGTRYPESAGGLQDSEQDTWTTSRR